MGSLIYSAIASLDGYVADERGEFGWAAPDEEVHAFVNDLERPVGTHLYGRRMYEVMVAWESDDAFPDPNAVTRDFAGIWRAADKVVYSTTLATVASARTRLERSFDADEVGRSVAGAERDVSHRGPGPGSPRAGGRDRRRAPPDRRPRDRRGRDAVAPATVSGSISTCSTSAASRADSSTSTTGSAPLRGPDLRGWGRPGPWRSPGGGTRR